MTVLCVIGARGGSQGLPGKNTKELLGKPLIAWTIETALETSEIDRVIVSTDSKRYAEISKKFGAEVPFLRPAKLSGNKSSDYDFMLHAVKWFEQNSNLPVAVGTL